VSSTVLTHNNESLAIVERVLLHVHVAGFHQELALQRHGNKTAGAKFADDRSLNRSFCFCKGSSRDGSTMWLEYAGMVDEKASARYIQQKATRNTINTTTKVNEYNTGQAWLGLGAELKRLFRTAMQ